MACIRFDNNQISWWDSTLHTFDLACTKIPENILRQSIIDIWLDYEYRANSVITNSIIFEKFGLTLCQINFEGLSVITPINEDESIISGSYELSSIIR